MMTLPNNTTTVVLYSLFARETSLSTNTNTTHAILAIQIPVLSQSPHPVMYRSACQAPVLTYHRT